MNQPPPEQPQPSGFNFINKPQEDNQQTEDKDEGQEAAKSGFAFISAEPQKKEADEDIPV